MAKRKMHLTKPRKRSWVHFSCKKAGRKDRRKSLSKKVLKKRQIYGILYMKLGAALGDPLRGLADLWRTGNRCISNKASMSDGDIFFKKKLRQICTAAAKLIL